MPPLQARSQACVTTTPLCVILISGANWDPPQRAVRTFSANAPQPGLQRQASATYPARTFLIRRRPGSDVVSRPMKDLTYQNVYVFVYTALSNLSSRHLQGLRF